MRRHFKRYRGNDQFTLQMQESRMTSFAWYLENVQHKRWVSARAAPVWRDPAHSALGKALRAWRLCEFGADKNGLFTQWSWTRENELRMKPPFESDSGQ
jgi:hypothetical protein